MMICKRLPVSMSSELLLLKGNLAILPLPSAVKAAADYHIFAQLVGNL